MYIGLYCPVFTQSLVLNLTVENCVRAKDEKKYYNDILDYSIKNLMLFPYHLADVIVKKLDVSPFQFYVSMLEGLMAQDKSYDSLPNFTAADCKPHSYP